MNAAATSIFDGVPTEEIRILSLRYESIHGQMAVGRRQKLGARHESPDRYIAAVTGWLTLLYWITKAFP
jgi:hypothetical protein